MLKNALLGSWRGENLLRLSWMEPSEFISAGTMEIAPAAAGKLLECTYNWHHDNQDHSGVFLIAYDKKAGLVTLAWGDSWHMSSKLMFCEGQLTEQGAIDVRGSYAAPPDADWGWRIVLVCNDDDTLHMTMYNVTPAGEEDLAVKAIYHRIS